VDHISGGRLDLGIGIGLTSDPACAMMGLPNWSNKERVARLRDYVAIVDQLLSNEVTTYEGAFYRVEGAVMNPRPVQTPRPPIMIAANGPVMLGIAARHADIWNCMSFAASFDAQMDEMADRVAQINRHCEALGRDPASLRRSYHMFDTTARQSGGLIGYYESDDLFVEMVERILALGFTEIDLYHPTVESQRPAFERIATEVIPKLRARHAATGA
jgi:alkanesulfonate monooxygenase SsuD/methylene tetrahydromethanopterin reductase-like flavin-dependent oxidoreductase (luciferase family)